MSMGSAMWKWGKETYAGESNLHVLTLSMPWGRKVVGSGLGLKQKFSGMSVAFDNSLSPNWNSSPWMPLTLFSLTKSNGIVL